MSNGAALVDLGGVAALYLGKQTMLCQIIYDIHQAVSSTIWDDNPFGVYEFNAL